MWFKGLDEEILKDFLWFKGQAAKHAWHRGGVNVVEAAGQEESARDAGGHKERDCTYQRQRYFFLNLNVIFK